MISTLQSEKLNIACGCDLVVNIYSALQCVSSMHKLILSKLPYTQNHNPWLVYLLLHFWRQFCPYVWSVFKRGLYSRAGYDGMRTLHFLKIQYAESYRPVHCAVNVTSPEVSRSYSEKVHKLDSSEIFLLFSSFFLLFCHAKFQMLFKVCISKVL